MNAKIRGYKEGIISDDLTCPGGSFRKGTTVRYRRYKTRDRFGCWDGGFEYYYLDLNNSNLIRSPRLLVDEK